MLVNALGVVVTAALFLIPSILGAGSNQSQNVVPNAAGDAALDQAKVDKYKSLLGKEPVHHLRAVSFMDIDTRYR